MTPHVWAPLALSEAVRLFAGAPFRWWISGGHALELHLGRSWRSHGDLDVGILRSQAPLAHRWLSDWDLHTAALGRLSPWDGGSLSGERHENNVWARMSPEAPWSFDLTINAGTDERWIYRRDPAVWRRWDEAVLESTERIPYLAPELQLLFKSKDPRPKDDLDAAEVIPALDLGQRTFLREHLPGDHRWLASLGAD